MRRHVDDRGRPVNEQGRPLVGLAPPDSPAYAEFLALESDALADLASLRDRDVADEHRRRLEALVAATTDAGEREDAQVRLTRFTGLVGAGDRPRTAYDEAVDVAESAIDTGGTSAERLAALRRGVERMLAIARTADHGDADAIRDEVASLERIAEGVRADPGERGSS